MVTSQQNLGEFGDIGDFGIGLWRMTTPSVDEARKYIESSLDAGVRLLDNADIYGANWGGSGRGSCEEMLGKVFAADKSLRQRCVLATKGGIIPGVPYDQSSAVLRKSCEDSLRRMGVDRIDLYFIHRPDLFAHPAEVAETLMALRSEGKIAEVGVSNFTVAQYDALRSFLPFKIVASQPEYSAANLGPLRDGTFDSCMRDGVIPFAWSPLAGGRLLTGESMRPELITALDEIADRHSTTRDAICYAFILSHPSRPIVLLGSQRPERIASAVNNPLRELPKIDLYKIVAASEGKKLP